MHTLFDEVMVGVAPARSLPTQCKKCNSLVWSTANSALLHAIHMQLTDKVFAYVAPVCSTERLIFLECAITGTLMVLSTACLDIPVCIAAYAVSSC